MESDREVVSGQSQFPVRDGWIGTLEIDLPGDLSISLQHGRQQAFEVVCFGQDWFIGVPRVWNEAGVILSRKFEVTKSCQPPT